MNVRTGGYTGLEMKYRDSEVNEGIGTTWLTSAMDPPMEDTISACPVGDGEQDRNGRKYTIHSIHLKGFFHQETQDQSIVQEDFIVRLVLVLDKQTNNVQLSGSDVFKSPITPQETNAFRNLQFSKRFTVLKDKRIRISSPEAIYKGDTMMVNQAGVNVPFVVNHTFRNGLDVLCTGSTAQISSIMDNSLHVLCLTEVAQVGLNLFYNARVRFTG